MLIDTTPQQTLLQIRQTAELLTALNMEDLTDAGRMCMFDLHWDIVRAVSHLEENYTFNSKELEQ